MSIFKLKYAGTALVALTLLVASSQVARAETIFLKCVGQENYNTMFTFSVDLTNRTVNGKPADITPLSVSWHTSSIGGGITADTLHSIDRTTGIYTFRTVYHAPEGDRIADGTKSPFSCTQVSAPPTKF